MNHQGMRPAPYQWTLTIAKHLKSRAPNTLVMDGSFARNDDPSRCYPQDVLENPDVDIVSPSLLYSAVAQAEVKKVFDRSLIITMEVETSDG